MIPNLVEIWPALALFEFLHCNSRMWGWDFVVYCNLLQFCVWCSDEECVHWIWFDWMSYLPDSQKRWCFTTKPADHSASTRHRKNLSSPEYCTQLRVWFCGDCLNCTLQQNKLWECLKCKVWQEIFEQMCKCVIISFVQMRQRPLPMKLVTVGKDRGVSLQSVSVEYIKKIQRYCTFEEIQLRPNPKKSRCAAASTLSCSSFPSF